MIEDDARLAQMVGEYLERSGFTVTHGLDARSGMALLQEPQGGVPVELLILDLMLPDMDGLEVCRRVRAMTGEVGKVPILMLTAKGDPMDRIVGLELGADDYLPKPFEPRELLARIRAILRRRSEGLGQVIVRAQLEADDAVHRVALGREHQDRHLAHLAGHCANAPADLQAVHVRQHQVQDQQLHRHTALRLLQQRHTGPGVQPVGDGEARALEVLAHHLREAGVVFDHEELLHSRMVKAKARGSVHLG